MTQPKSPWLVASALLALLSAVAAAQEEEVAPVSVAVEESRSPIADALTEQSGEVRIYNDHVVTLASPFMEGRVPGSRGMEIAKEYMEFYFKRAGLQPPFAGEEEGTRSYRQGFPLNGPLRIVDQYLANTLSGEVFTPETDYVALGSGGSGEVEGQVVFVGYSIQDGPEGYHSFAEGDDLTGKIALILRFEPMDGSGKSLWSERGPWTNRAGYAGKIDAAVERGAVGVLMVNTPGAKDPRIHEPLMSNFSGRGNGKVPVMILGTEAAERMVRAADPDGRTLKELRLLADRRGIMRPLNATMKMRTDLKRETLTAQNVAGLLSGRGKLKDEIVVIGAHLDHLGMGLFGSRTGPGSLHPGADDNASGSAAVLMLAASLAKSYRELPDHADARSILLMGFSAEESGLNGSRFYATNPIAPAEQHVLMINFDMIGRIANGRLSVSGANTGNGMGEFLQPIIDQSELTVIQPPSVMAASDHSSFMQQRIPVLFGIIADFHSDYHTPKDESWRINRVDAVRTVHLFHDIAYAVATRPERFEYAPPSPRGRRGVAGGGQGAQPRRSNLKVRVGLRPGSYDENEVGVLVGGVTEGGSAAGAGLKEGDRMVSWDGEKISNVSKWMELLAKHKPGDEVEVGLVRDGEDVTVKLKLQGREESDG